MYANDDDMVRIMTTWQANMDFVRFWGNAELSIAGKIMLLNSQSVLLDLLIIFEFFLVSVLAFRFASRSEIKREKHIHYQAMSNLPFVCRHVTINKIRGKEYTIEGRVCVKRVLAPF